MVYLLSSFSTATFEVMGTASIRLLKGSTKLVPTLVLFERISMTLLIFALRHLEVSVVYVVKAGLGKALVSTIGIHFFEISMSVLKRAQHLSVLGVHKHNLAASHQTL